MTYFENSPEIAPKFLHLVNFNHRYITFTMVEIFFWKYTLEIAPEWLHFITFEILVEDLSGSILHF